MANSTSLPWDPSQDTKLQVANLSSDKVSIPIPKKEQVLAAALKNMSECLDDYKTASESFWTFGALKMEQQFQVNEETQTSAQDAHFARTFFTRCPKNGKLTLVHCFQATRFVPIPNTEYALQELNDQGISQGKKITGKLDQNGTTTLSLKPDVRYKVIFYPNVGKKDVDALLQSYDAVQQQLIQWLQQQWDSSLKLQWQSFESLTPSTQQLIQQSFSKGVLSSLIGVWDDLSHLYDLFAHPLDHAKQALHTALELDYQQIYEATKKGLSTGLSITQDEVLLFLFAYTLVNWIRLLPPNKQGEVIGEVITSMLTDILIGLVLTGGLGLATKYGAKAYSTMKDAGMIQQAIQDLITLAGKIVPKHLPHAEKILQQGEAGISDIAAAGTKIGKGKDPSEMMQNAVVSARKQGSTTKLVLQEEKPVTASTVGKTDAHHAADPVSKTCTNNCPVSMVTGEELLTLDDGYLGGIFPFSFQRTYRSSAAETNQGMGFGWSHSLAHQLSFAEDKVFWRDHEGRTIEFPEPSAELPTIHNPLAGAAIWLGRRKDELILTQPNLPRYHFIRRGNTAQLSSLTDKYGNRLLVHYDDQGDLRRLELPGVHALQFYFSQGLLQRIDRCVSDPDTPTREWQQHLLVRYHYNDQQQLIGAENSIGETEHYRYNEQHIIQERQLAGGVQFFWTWEREGKYSRCVRHWSPQAGFDASYAWNDNGTVTVTNIDGSEEVYQHDDRAKLITQKDPDGAEIRKIYDDDGNLRVEIDALGHETQYIYDADGNLATVMSADGQVIEYEYFQGYLRKITQGDACWRYQRNAQGDITEQTTPDGVRTRYQYSETGQLTAITYADGCQHFLTFNRFGQLVEEKDPQGGIQKYRYDALGRLVLEQSTQGAITRYAYDSLDRVTDVLLPNGTKRRYSYNAYGKVTSFTNERGLTTRYEYGHQRHLVTAQHNPDGSILRFGYNNPKLFLSDITNERGEQYQLQYFPNGLVKSEIDFAGRTTAYRYDLNGELIEKQEFSSVDDTVLTTCFTRDPMGRLLSKTLPDGSTVEYRYDPAGNLIAVSDGNWPLHYEYDHAGRLTAEHQGFATTRYGYNAMGQLERCKLPDSNLLSYHYFRGGLLQGIDLNGLSLSRHDYTNGLESRRQLGMLQGQYQYDEQGRLREQKVQLSRPTLNAFKVQRRYHYDPLGNLTKLEDSHKGTREFLYDPLERLTRVRGAVEEYFSHDMAGNLLSQFSKNPQTTETVGNRLQFQGDRHFEYDGFGNLITEKRGKNQQLVTRYHYDCQHRLVKLERYDGTIAQYKYDAFGRRIEKQVSYTQPTPDNRISNVVPLNQTTQSKPKTEKTTFLWQANRLIAETNHQESYRSFIYEPRTYKPLAQLEGKGKTAEVYYYHLDHLGTPQELTNKNGNLVWAVQYRAYGNVIRTIANDIETPLRFQGQYFDAESGLHYNRHRYYQSETGRFLTPDPIKLAGGLNNYQYAPNPVNWVDPLGLANKKENGVNSYTINDYRQKLNEKLGRTGSLHNDINIRQAKSTAFDFYKEQGFDEASIPSHLNGIDFNHTVEIETLNKGKKVYQYQSHGSPQGNYYTANSKTTPSELGIGSLGDNRSTGTIEPKIQTLYKLKLKTKVLKSTSKSIDDTWSARGLTQPSSGGGTQLFTSQKGNFEAINR